MRVLFNKSTPNCDEDLAAERGYRPMFPLLLQETTEEDVDPRASAASIVQFLYGEVDSRVFHYVMEMLNTLSSSPEPWLVMEELEEVAKAAQRC